MSDVTNTFQIVPRLGDNYSDVTIIFSDPRSSVEMRLHRVFLAWTVPYFDTLFLFSDNLKRDEFIVPVEDAAVAELFIKVLYGQKPDFLSDCYTFLHFCKLRSYFCLDLDLKKLCKIVIPAENFDLFLQVVSLPEVKLSQRLVRTIRRNVPKDYTWEGIDENLKKEVTKRSKYIISGHRGGNIKMWDLDLIEEKGMVSKSCVKTLTGHTKSVTSIVVTEDQQQIVSVSDDTTIKIWEISSGECVKTLTGHNDCVTSIVITEDQQQIISASEDKTIKIWEIANGECLKTLTGHTRWITSIVITEDQQQIISASYDKTIKIWEIAGGECVKTLSGHTRWITSIVMTKDQQQIISAGCNGEIKIWEIASGECVKKLTGHIRWISSIVITKDQQKIISSDEGGKIKIWKMSSEKCVRTLPGDENISSLALISF